jgi:DNA polymerase-3 subunit alpha
VHTRHFIVTQQVQDRLQKELKVIIELEFVLFCFFNYCDIVSYAKSKRYVLVGNQSGSNSIVAYNISITVVNFVELDLYFERLINPLKASPPDFDIYFSWEDKNDVTNYIIIHFKNTELLATYNTFRYKAVIRELGKVFGLPKEEIDKLNKTSRQQKKFLNSAETPQNEAFQKESNKKTTV